MDFLLFLRNLEAMTLISSSMSEEEELLSTSDLLSSLLKDDLLLLLLPELAEPETEDLLSDNKERDLEELSDFSLLLLCLDFLFFLEFFLFSYDECLEELC